MCDFFHFFIILLLNSKYAAKAEKDTGLLSENTGLDLFLTKNSLTGFIPLKNFKIFPFKFLRLRPLKSVVEIHGPVGFTLYHKFNRFSRVFHGFSEGGKILFFEACEHPVRKVIVGVRL